MTKEPNCKLIERFFKGECTPGEAYEVLKWAHSLEGEDEIKKSFDAFKANDFMDVPSSKMMEKIHERIKLESIIKSIDEESNQVSFELIKQNTNRFNWRKIAASVLLLISFGLVLYLSIGQYESKQELNLQTAELVTKTTEAGQKLIVHLRDGSKATLNSESSIKYSKDFTDSVRFISMTGEVFFEVAENPLKPFIVEAYGVQTTALGTSFDVEAYGGFNQVSLLTGKVKVASVTDSFEEYLVPGELLALKSGSAKKSSFDLKKASLWKSGIIFFDQTPLHECYQILERWYGVDIEVDGMPSDTRFVSARFDNDNLTNVLNTLGHIHGFEYKMVNKKVEIKF